MVKHRVGRRKVLEDFCGTHRIAVGERDPGRPDEKLVEPGEIEPRRPPSWPASS